MPGCPEIPRWQPWFHNSELHHVLGACAPPWLLDHELAEGQRVGLQMAEEKLRIEDDESNTRKKLKEMREDHKQWEETRDNRVSPASACNGHHVGRTEHQEHQDQSREHLSRNRLPAACC